MGYGSLTTQPSALPHLRRLGQGADSLQQPRTTNWELQRAKGRTSDEKHACAPQTPRVAATERSSHPVLSG